MSRNLPWLAELQPELFAEIDPVLAADRGIEDGGWMVISPSAARSRRGPRSRGASVRCGSTAGSCTRSPCRGTGALHDVRAGRHGRLAQRPDRALGRPQHRRSRTRRSPATSAPAAGRRDDREARGAHGGETRHVRPTIEAETPDRLTSAAERDHDVTEIAVRRPPSASASSPTRPSASAARPARSRASSGTTSPPTARTSARAARSTTPARCRRGPGGTSTSSRSPPSGRARAARGATCVAAAPATTSTCWPWRRAALRSGWTAGCSSPTSASTARTPAAWTPARPAR